MESLGAVRAGGHQRQEQGEENTRPLGKQSGEEKGWREKILKVKFVAGRSVLAPTTPRVPRSRVGTWTSVVEVGVRMLPLPKI